MYARLLILITDSILLGMDDTSLCPNLCRDVLPFFTDNSFQLLFAGGVLLFYIPLLNTLKVFYWIQVRDILGKVIVFVFFFFKNSCVIFEVCLESLSCSKTPLLETGIHLFIQYLGIQTCIHSALYKCQISPTLFTHMQPHIGTLPPPCFMVDTMQSLR